MSLKGWNIRAVQAREAMAALASHQGGVEVDWGDVAIAHLDTGYTPHPVFRLPAPDKGSWIDVERGRNLMDKTTDLPRDPLDYVGPLEFPGHGTRTLSVLAGGLPGEFVGVAPGVPVLPYRVTNTVTLDISKQAQLNIAEAIYHAVDRNGCDVISISLGKGLAASRHIGAAVDYAYERGVIVCCAAGQEFEHMVYPARHARSIACGGVTPKREIWVDYRLGRERVAVWAPADEISRANAVRLPTGEEKYSYADDGDGTSYATVHVAAAAAMWLTRQREVLDAKVWRSPLRVEAFRRLLRQTAKSLVATPEKAHPSGLLQMKELLAAALPDPATLEPIKDKAEDDLA